MEVPEIGVGLNASSSVEVIAMAIFEPKHMGKIYLQKLKAKLWMG
jgi:hypothetical protein